MEFCSYGLILWTLGTPHGVYPGPKGLVHAMFSPGVTRTGNFAPEKQYFLEIGHMSVGKNKTAKN